MKTNSQPKTTKRPNVIPQSTKPAKQQAVAQHKETPSNQNECSGDCVNGLIALFCDDVDADAFCPNEGSCCITQDEKLQLTTPKITTPVRGPRYHNAPPNTNQLCIMSSRLHHRVARAFVC